MTEMLLQALVVGRALIESCRIQAQHKLESVTSRSYSQYRNDNYGMVLRKRSPKTNQPAWNTVYDTRLARQRTMGTTSRDLISNPKSPYHRPASRYEPFAESAPTSVDGARAQLERIEFVESDFADMKWTPIYRFPRIALSATLSRAKLVQTALCVTMAAVSVYMYAQGSIQMEQVKAINFVSLFSAAVLYLMSGYSRRLVGVASMSPCRQWMRIAHTDFFGRRVNVICPVEDIVPWSETSPAPNHMYGTFARYSHPKQQLVMPTHYGCIVDDELFAMAFGNEARKWVVGRADSQQTTTEDDGAAHAETPKEEKKTQ